MQWCLFGTNLIECSEDHYINVPVLRYIAPDFSRLLFISTTQCTKDTVVMNLLEVVLQACQSWL